MKELDEITGTIADAALQIHRDLGHGLLDSVYEMARALERRGLSVVRQKPVRFSYDGRSDLFDALPLLTREARVEKAKVAISTHFNSPQQVFLDFVLSHYVNAGVEELDREKLTPLLRLKYHDSIADAVADLGRPDAIGETFAGFQRHLYEAPLAG